VSEVRTARPATGALLGLKPSRIIHPDTFIERHAVLIYSSTPHTRCIIVRGVDRLPSHA